MTLQDPGQERRSRRGSHGVQVGGGTLRSSIGDLEQQAQALVTQRPIAAALTAVCIGYIVARLVSRR